MVIGAESTGTRLVTSLLIKNGVFGDSTHEQRLDSFNKEALKDSNVIRRSIPHAQKYPELEKILEFLGDVKVIITVRTWSYMLNSQVLRVHVSDVQRARERTKKAYKHIFKFVTNNDLDYTVVNFDSLIQDPKQQRWVVEEVGLEFKHGVKVHDTNTKHQKN